jgi:D-galacturonate reductase
VVALTLFDLRRLGKVCDRLVIAPSRNLIFCPKVEKLAMVGTNGKKFPDIRTHLQDKIAGAYKDMDVS